MKINLLLASIFLSIIIYANSNYLHGIVGMTLRDGGLGCACHGANPNDSVNVWIEGPDSLIKGQSAFYTLLMTGGPAVEGGFNIASYTGELNPTDTLTRILFGELTHSFPNPFLNDTVKWSFSFTAPDSVMTDTIYFVGNSVNGDGNPGPLDRWNFGENFVIQIIDKPVNVIAENLLPEKFVLYQNYPNPFNPETSIQYAVGSRQLITLKVYDILGNEIATFVNEEKSAGSYEISFNGSGLPSGIYFARLTTGNQSAIIKMSLMK
jgi:hypothetical protein